MNRQAGAARARARSSPARPPGDRRRSGAVAVESALALLILLGLVLALIDVARWLHALHASGEAVREGVRTAVVCNLGSTTPVRSRMAPWLSLAGGAGASRIAIEPEPAGCVARATEGAPVCVGVRVRLLESGLGGISWWLPVLGLPPTEFYLTRESLDSTDNAARCG